MQISQTNKDGLKHSFKVIVTADNFSHHVAEKLQAIGKKVKLPGFRPGKVPANILKQRYIGDATEEALNKVVNTAVRQIIKDNSLRQLHQPEVDIVSFEENKDLEFSVTIETLPNIVVQDFKHIALEKLVVALNDRDVADVLSKDAAEHKSFVALKKERSAKKGDEVSISCVATMGGAAFKHLPETFNVELSDEAFILFPELKKGLEGKKVGDVVQIAETFSAQANPEFVGKTVDITATVTEIKERAVFKADLDFAKELGFETFDALQEAARKKTQNYYDGIARLYLKRHLLDTLAKEYTFDLPASMVDAEFEDIWTRLQAEIKDAREAGTLDPEDDKPEDELRAEYKGIAERRVRLGLLISEIGQVNKMQLTEEEKRRAVFQEAMRYPQQMLEVVEYFRKNPGALDRIVAPIMEDKVVDFILDAAQLTETTVDIVELKKKVSGIIPGFFEDEDIVESQKTPAAAKEKPKAKKAKGQSE